MCGRPEGEAGAAEGAVGRGECAAVGLGDPEGDGQAEAEAGGAGAAVEAVEERVGRVGWYSGARVVDGEYAAGGDTELDLGGPVRRVPVRQRVDEQVGDGAAQQVPAPPVPDRGGAVGDGGDRYRSRRT
ncbi:hypothetical protein GCM10010341_78250 [Streptomyces noursei]|nr:hypothetical protein GCM10010341_78250 [Streptomyces noursei]